VATFGLATDPSLDWGARLWLRQEIKLLAGMLATAATPTALEAVHRLASTSLFGYVPVLLLIDDEHRVLATSDGHRIALDSQTSALARAAREGIAVDLSDAPTNAVADRQLLSRIGESEGVAVPLGTHEPVGVLIFATDGERHARDEELLEYARRLYGEQLANHWHRARSERTTATDLLARYREVEHKRLREVVHEVNNPLSVVRNYLHILELRLQHEPSAVEQLQLVGDELSRAASILETAKEMSDPTALGAEVRGPFAEAELNANLRRALQVHRAYADERFVSLVARLTDGELRLSTVESKLQQVLANLIRNAIEACRRGDQVTVESAGGVYRQGAAGVEFTVRDTGPGMPPEVLARLFEPKRSTKGSDHAGLGLSIVGRLVRELGGALDVRTAQNTGTSVAVFLPY
jgi:signal transduction histidine kinase